MISIKANRVAEIVEAALAIAEKAGPTTPESRAIIIAAAIAAVYGNGPSPPQLGTKAPREFPNPTDWMKKYRNPPISHTAKRG